MALDLARCAAQLAMTVSVGGHRIRVSLRRPERANFWRRVETGAWEAATLRFVRNTIDEGTTFVDIGAWIGPISLVAGARAKRVIAIEPDPIAASELEENVALNDAPILVWRAGIDAARGSLRLFAKTGFGDTMTSSLGDPAGESIRVEAVTFDDISATIDARPGKVVVKMDVEGHEFEVGEQLVAFVRRHGAPLSLSLHPAILNRQARRKLGAFSARMATLCATRNLVERLKSHGQVRLSKTGQPVTLALLASFVFLRRRPKNFSVDVFPPNWAKAA
jgi:FkbM family methyltransferase